jgi:hypothetical protein
MAGVGTSKLLENDRVIVWEMVLEPGESTGVHTHEHGYIIQVMEGSILQATDAQGENPIDLDFATNDTYWVDVKDGEVILGDTRASATHDAKNIGPNRYRELLVEIK